MITQIVLYALALAVVAAVLQPGVLEEARTSLARRVQDEADRAEDQRYRADDVNENQGDEH